MATITGLTAERMLEIEAASVVDGDIVGDDLVLARRDGSLINAGSVRGSIGPEGPMGSSLQVESFRPVLDVGMANQIKAGRQLTPQDFANIGVKIAPDPNPGLLALWNLSNANDSSGLGRHLTIKGGVPFGVGINGQPSTAAVFSGAASQALYLPDGGASDPIRLRAGTFGCWHRTAKRGTANYFFVRSNVASGTWSWYIGVQTNGTLIWSVFDGATSLNSLNAWTVTDLCDDRWHFVVCTVDGTMLRAYIDGNYEGGRQSSLNLSMYNGPAVTTIGGYAGDQPSTSNPSYGRVDEAFICKDVLNEDQIRNLYAAQIPHALGSVPNIVRLGVRRKKRGVLAVSDFPSQPLRLYNLTDGSLVDQGSQNAPLTLGAGTIFDVAGADGVGNGAKHFVGAHGGLRATEVGLGFTALQARSHGCWFKSNAYGVGGTMYSWGSDERLQVSATNNYSAYNAPDMISVPSPMVLDGLWHFGIMVEDPNPADGIKRRLYCDGRVVGISTALNAITVGSSATGFAIGMNATSGGQWIGDLDAVFVYNGALTHDQVLKLYHAGAEELGVSPKDEAEHIESVELGRLLVVMDGIESTDSIDLAVMS
jgi:hypothetical protein